MRCCGRRRRPDQLDLSGVSSRGCIYGGNASISTRPHANVQKASERRDVIVSGEKVGISLTKNGYLYQHLQVPLRAAPAWVGSALV